MLMDTDLNLNRPSRCESAELALRADNPMRLLIAVMHVTAISSALVGFTFSASRSPQRLVVACSAVALGAFVSALVLERGLSTPGAQTPSGRARARW